MIQFAHTDLATTNIIISHTSTEVLGIIDWQESGWYPEYWEYLKAKHTALTRWYDYLDIALQHPYVRELEAFESYDSTGIFI